MSDPDGFLGRWSRRKLAAASLPAREAERPPESAAAAPEAGGQPVPDLEALPAITDIVADTDISAFLRPGVPLDLVRSALRQSWSADVAIRDFVGPADYAWDFNAPDAAPGFGPLGLSDAMRDQIVQALFSAPSAADADSAEVTTVPEPYPAASCPQIPAPRPAAAMPVAPTFDDVAEKPVEPGLPAQSRRHGGALPE